MSKQRKTLSELEIASLLRKRQTFEVKNNRDRINVLSGAKFLGVEVSTKLKDGGGFTVKFVQQ